MIDLGDNYFLMENKNFSSKFVIFKNGIGFSLDEIESEKLTNCRANLPALIVSFKVGLPILKKKLNLARNILPLI